MFVRVLSYVYVCCKSVLVVRARVLHVSVRLCYVAERGREEEKKNERTNTTEREKMGHTERERETHTETERGDNQNNASDCGVCLCKADLMTWKMVLDHRL
jgi:hypothetical protein